MNTMRVIRRVVVALAVVAFLIVASILVWQTGHYKPRDTEMGNFLKKNSRFEKPEVRVMRPGDFFEDSFQTDRTLEEVGALASSGHSHWWVNSGGIFTISSGTAETIQGDLSESNAWYRLYQKTNARDTDGGLHPQNIFRLVETDVWNNFSQHMYFQINRINMSDSPNRNESNGIFLFNRYQTGDNLYYTGLRVDGAAVIKKKMNGTYYTMAYKKIFDGTYDKAARPNLLPTDMWLGIKSEVVTNSDGTVTIRLYTDIGKTDVWTLALDANDNGTEFGGDPLRQSGYVGVRTDFMDVSFSEYRVDEF